MADSSTNNLGQTFLKVSELALLLRLSKVSVYRLVERRSIPFHRLPRGLRFSRDDVDAYAVESQKRAARAWAENRFARSVFGVKEGVPWPGGLIDERLVWIDHHATSIASHPETLPGIRTEGVAACPVGCLADLPRDLAGLVAAPPA